ncbi:MAG: hypothetical protein WDW36_009176 [Sanguina aurantia]
MTRYPTRDTAQPWTELPQVALSSVDKSGETGRQHAGAGSAMHLESRLPREDEMASSSQPPAPTLQQQLQQLQLQQQLQLHQLQMQQQQQLHQMYQQQPQLPSDFAHVASPSVQDAAQARHYDLSQLSGQRLSPGPADPSAPTHNFSLPRLGSQPFQPTHRPRPHHRTNSGGLAPQEPDPPSSSAAGSCYSHDLPPSSLAHRPSSTERLQSSHAGRLGLGSGFSDAAAGDESRGKQHLHPCAGRHSTGSGHFDDGVGVSATAPAASVLGKQHAFIAHGRRASVPSAPGGQGSPDVAAMPAPENGDWKRSPSFPGPQIEDRITPNGGSPSASFARAALMSCEGQNSSPTKDLSRRVCAPAPAETQRVVRSCRSTTEYNSSPHTSRTSLLGTPTGCSSSSSPLSAPVAAAAVAFAAAVAAAAEPAGRTSGHAGHYPVHRAMTFPGNPSPEYAPSLPFRSFPDLTGQVQQANSTGDGGRQRSSAHIPHGRRSSVAHSYSTPQHRNHADVAAAPRHGVEPTEASLAMLGGDEGFGRDGEDSLPCWLLGMQKGRAE